MTITDVRLIRRSQNTFCKRMMRRNDNIELADIKTLDYARVKEEQRL